MKAKNQYSTRLSAPNLINLCIDQKRQGELSGRIYHCYDRKPQEFQNMIQMLKTMEQFYDSISFPQAAEESRYFIRPETCCRSCSCPERRMTQQELIQHRGRLGTFVTCVKCRQHSTWQGEVIWLEKDSLQRFSSPMELIRLLDATMEPRLVKIEKN